MAYNLLVAQERGESPPQTPAPAAAPPARAPAPAPAVTAEVADTPSNPSA